MRSPAAACSVRVMVAWSCERVGDNAACSENAHCESEDHETVLGREPEDDETQARGKAMVDSFDGGECRLVKAPSERKTDLPATLARRFESIVNT